MANVAPSRAAWIAGTYCTVASLWIVFSDRALAQVLPNPEALVSWSVAKGLAFVGVTGLGLLLLMRRAFGAIERGYEEAKHERAFSNTIVESLPGIVYFYDRNGRFLRWNRNFEAVSGYSGADIGRMHPLDFLADDEKAIVSERIGEVFSRGASSVTATFVARDGTKTPYYFTGNRLEFDGGECLVGVGLDISERVRMESALREANESLERKVEERTTMLQDALVRAESADHLKSAFLATMSHELRTPLNSILGFTGIVLQGLAGPITDEQGRQLGMVQTSARHLLDLINDVLDISKIEAGQVEVHPEPFDVAASIARVTGIVGPMAEKKGLTLTVDVADPLPPLVSDRRRVEQILLNLLNNAVKFTERGGVTLTVETYDQASGASSQPYIRFVVADTGIGIQAEHLQTLFQPFRQIDSGLTRQHEGTGLGLAICRRLAALLGGTIGVESTYGAGSRFHVALPLEVAQPRPDECVPAL